jgi:hypothetical protein
VQGSDDISHVEVGHHVCRGAGRQGGRGADKGENVSALGLQGGNRAVYVGSERNVAGVWCPNASAVL